MFTLRQQFWVSAGVIFKYFQNNFQIFIYIKFFKLYMMISFKLRNVCSNMIIEAMMSLFNNVSLEKWPFHTAAGFPWHPPISLLRRETCKFISFSREKNGWGVYFQRAARLVRLTSTNSLGTEIYSFGLLYLIWESTGQSAKRTGQHFELPPEQPQMLWRHNTGISYQIWLNDVVRGIVLFFLSIKNIIVVTRLLLNMQQQQPAISL